MNVGIMSMQRVRNYGSYLQAYGLKKVLEEMGHTVFFVDYQSGRPLPDGGGSRKNVVYRALRMLSPEYRAYREKQIKMNRTFSEFCSAYDSRFLPELGVGASYVYTPEADALVIGSDEVFNCTQEGGQVGYSLQLFGKDNRAGRLLSYAASFGSTTMQKLEKYEIAGEIADCLRQFNDISVRDQNSVQIVESLCGYRPQRHIDPVLLYDFPETEEIRVSLKDYIVVYAYADRICEEEADAIRAFAEKEGKKILTLGFYQPFCDEYILTSPVEVLAYVKNADYVITDTFHGAVFSIKYQVPFAAIVRQSNQQKLEDLLSLFELKSCIAANAGEMESILKSPVNRSQIQDILKREQESAMEYLERNLPYQLQTACSEGG